MVRLLGAARAALIAKCEPGQSPTWSYERRLGQPSSDLRRNCSRSAKSCGRPAATLLRISDSRSMNAISNVSARGLYSLPVLSVKTTPKIKITRGPGSCVEAHRKAPEHQRPRTMALAALQEREEFVRPHDRVHRLPLAGIRRPQFAQHPTSAPTHAPHRGPK
jgi:hypothetical protein